MQLILANSDYTFDASEQEITLVAPSNILDVERILRITNITTKAVIYDSERRTYPISIAAGVITHTYDLAGMADADELQIVVDGRGSTLLTRTYQAAAAADIIVKASPGLLHSIIVGKDVAGGIIEVSDHATDGDGNVVLYLADPDVGTYLVDAEFAVGIAVDMTTQTNVTFVWR